MTYDGTNYPATEHSILFWVVFLVIVIVATTTMLGLFLIAVGRDGEKERAEAVDEPAELPGHGAPTAVGHSTAA